MRIHKLLLQDLKNIAGFRTSRKLVVFAVDDYGNVRVNSAESLHEMQKAGIKATGRFSRYDSLETREDLEQLFDVLSSVKDRNGNFAVFTAYAMPVNIDFERIIAEDYTSYHYELLPVTFRKLELNDPLAYKGTWKLWQAGMNNKLLVPQFHGREHLNLKLLNEKLYAKDPLLLTAINNRSYTGLPFNDYPTISYTAAFEFFDFAENKNFEEVISSGIDLFREVFDIHPICFTPPAYHIHPSLLKFLCSKGIRFTDSAFFEKIHQGKEKFTYGFNYTGKKEPCGMKRMVRNVLFEPASNTGVDWVQDSLLQIEAAFRWKKPAIISSHRVNYCGHLDPQNRKSGLQALKSLLNKITQKWPDAEFISAPDLGSLIDQKNS